MSLGFKRLNNIARILK